VSLAGIATDPGTGHLIVFGGTTTGDAVSGQTWIWGPLAVSEAPTLAPGSNGLSYSNTLRSTGGSGTVH